MSKGSESKTIQKPLVAIGIPVYNGDKYIIEALESVSKQTHDNFECYIVNNASTDGTRELVTDYIKDKKRFKLYNYTDFVDIDSNWNRTVDHIPVGAKYFKVMQADDIIFPKSVKTMVDLMEKYPEAGIASSYRLINTRLEGYGADYFQGNLLNGKEVLLKHLLGQIELTGTNTQNLYRIETLKRLTFFPKIFLSDDLHTDARLAYELYLISDLAFAFDILSLTRRHSESETSTVVDILNTQLHGEEFRLHRFKEIFPEIEDKYKEVRRKYAYFLFKSYLKNNRECIKWHNKHLKRKIKLSEYIAGVFWQNRFGLKLAKLLKKR